MSATAAPEVVGFLAEHPPFDALAAEDLQRVAGAVEIESHRAGTTIFSQGARAVEHLRVVRRGAVEIVADGRVLDLLGEGELFGHASMLSGYPAGFQARAVEDTQCYRITASVAESLLSGPEGLRYVARSLLGRPVSAGDREHGPFQDPSNQPVGTLIRSPPVVCEPDTPIRDAARLMTAGQSTSLVVKQAGGALGIVTDYDLRTRVLAEGLPADAPVSAAMTTPAYTCSPERPGGEVLLDMLDRGFRHFPVVTAGGVIFIAASKDERLHAFDQETGKLLWQADLPAGGYATPATYEVKGRQYVVIACGGGKMHTKSGDAYVAFALPR